jgi:hypothetical protein
VTTTEFLFIKTRFEANEFQAFLAEIKSRNMHAENTDAATDALVTEESRMLTLATCSRVLEDARFVVHAVLVE